MRLIEQLADEVIRQTPQEPVGRGLIGAGLGGGGGKWWAGLSSPVPGTYISHSAARQNARTAMQDSPLARAMVERMADTVVDTGLRLELTPDFQLLGISREEAEAWATDVESRFHLWASDKKQHREGTLTFYQFQRMYQLWTQRDNDTFTRLYYDRKSLLQSPLQFSAVDPDQVRGDALTSTYGFQGGTDGIDRDDRGRETAYHIWVRTQSTQGAQVRPSTAIPTIGWEYKEVTIKAVGPGGRPLMLHGYRPEYAGQGRGFSRLAHAIQDFQNITDFASSTIKKAINQSQIVGFVEPSKDEDATNIMEEIMTEQGAGPAAQLFGSDPSTVPGVGVSPDLNPGVNACYELPEATNDVPGSMFFTNLTKGSKIKFAGNTAPGDSFDTFVDSFAGYLSAATSTPLEVVLMKFGNNYSASRATLLLFWRVACGWRAEQDADLLSPIVEAWMSEEIGAHRIVAPGWSDPRLRAAWLNKNWIGTSAPDIDPSKTARARRDNVEAGFSNIEREARDYNGTSAAANIERNNKLFGGMEGAPWSNTSAPADVTKTSNQAKAVLEDIAELLEGLGRG